MKIIGIILLFMVFAGTQSVSGKERLKEKQRVEILALLDKQITAWNEGNIDEFMTTYQNSDELAFVGGSGPVYGWKATLDRYRKGYPNKAAMGRLAFKVLRTSKIDRKTVLLIGRFELTREIGDAAGYFTLVIQKTSEGWKIISDHSSAEN